MHHVLRLVWALVAATSYLEPIANAAGVLDIGLVFPRANEIYEPADRFPIIFAIQNPELARHMQPDVLFQILNGSTTHWDPISDHGSFDLSSVNYTEQGREPYILWTHRKIDGQGPVRIIWQPSWSACEETGEDEYWLARNNSDNIIIDFEVQTGGQKVDLVAATADEKECPDQGRAITVTDETREASSWGGREGVPCAVLDFSSPLPTANPCRVKIDQAAVENKEAEYLEIMCRALGSDRPAECPGESLAAWKLGVPGFASFTAALGAAAFILLCRIQ